MRRSRVHTSQPLAVADSVELTGSAGHYLSRVLRLSKGDSVVLFNGDGCDYFADISEIQSQCVLLRITDSRFAANESPIKITLVQGVCRGERMDYVIQKSTELGVFCIQPLISQRVEVRLDAARQSKRMTHWQGVAISACEQSGRAFVPEVNVPLSLAEWLAGAGDSVCLVLDPLAESRLSGVSLPGDAVSILIGPEGGFSDGEMKALRAKGLISVSLGPRVLRTETAGPAAIAVLQSKLGDF